MPLLAVWQHFRTCPRFQKHHIIIQQVRYGNETFISIEFLSSSGRMRLR